MTNPNPTRLPVDNYFIQVAKLVSQRSTCRHRHQGTVLTSNNRIIATGYNGAAPGMVHCTDIGLCAKEQGNLCRAEGLHGESNAVASAAYLGLSTAGSTAYCVYSPCAACCNLLKSAGVVRVVYLLPYERFWGGPGYLVKLGIEVKRLGTPD